MKVINEFVMNDYHVRECREWNSYQHKHDEWFEIEYNGYWLGRMWTMSKVNKAIADNEKDNYLELVLKCKLNKGA